MERATAGSSAEAEELWLPAYEARLDALGLAVRGYCLPGLRTSRLLPKLELFFEHEREPNSVEYEVLAAIRRDAARLALVENG